jgi:hypothetical protein
MHFRIGVFLLNMYKAMVAGGTLGGGSVKNSHSRTNIVAFLGVVALSALTMIWFFWHYPVKTLIVTLAVLATLALLARVARLLETEVGPEFDRSESGI